MQKREKGWLIHALVILAYLLLALALTWPLATHLSSHVPGNGADDPPLTWNLWWVSHALLDLKTSPFDCDYLFYPLGINLAFYTFTVLNGLLSIPLQATIGLIPASNTLLLSSFVLCGYGAFLLVLYLLKQRSRGAKGRRGDIWCRVRRRPAVRLYLQQAFLRGTRPVGHYQLTVDPVLHSLSVQDRRSPPAMALRIPGCALSPVPGLCRDDLCLIPGAVHRLVGHMEVDHRPTLLARRTPIGSNRVAVCARARACSRGDDPRHARRR